jgi:hypothetical protein
MTAHASFKAYYGTHAPCDRGTRVARRVVHADTPTCAMAHTHLKGRVGLGMERGHAGNHADEHAHRVCVVIKRLHELAEVVVNGRVAVDLFLPVV